jgi:hypothetical protein
MTMGDGPADVAPLDPVVRFRIRTLLIATMCIAILAAMGGPYYRSVNASGQRNLLILWALVAICIAGSLFKQYRESFKIGRQRQVKYIVFALGRPTNRWRTIGFAVATIATFRWLGLLSHLAGTGANWKTYLLLCHGLTLGSTAASLVLVYVRRPMYLCEEGIPLARNYIAPWKYIRHAEWMTERPGVMKLRRVDGDIYLDVPNDVRAEVEAFVRGKTLFLDDVVRPPV